MGFPAGAVVVVDESGMVGSRQLAEVSDLVEAASGKLILIGDHHQLAEIDAGGLFAALVARLPAAELTENVRQDQEWERTALTELRQGSVSRAVAMYNRRGKINVAATDDDTIDQAVDAWYRDVEEIGDPPRCCSSAIATPPSTNSTSGPAPWSPKRDCFADRQLNAARSPLPDR